MSKKEMGADVIVQVAKNNGVEAEEMRNDMREEILAAYGNEETRHRWDEIFGKGVIPTPEELYCKDGANDIGAFARG